MTVGEALWFAPGSRLPADYSRRGDPPTRDEVLAQLDLTGSAEVLIGSPSVSGISGGQRRRVNLAMELLTDPPVLLLDEPTSGLSSEDALLVMNLLRKLADRGKTVLLAIHQPGRDLFRLLDRVAVVARDSGRPNPEGSPTRTRLPGRNPFLQSCTADELGVSCRAGTLPDDLLKGLARRPVRMGRVPCRPTPTPR